MNEHKYMWNHAGTSLLISIWSNSFVQKRLQSTLRNQPIWDGVARYMMRKGFRVNGKQCRTRIKNILVRYREIKKTGNFSGSGIESFFNEIDRVMTTKNAQLISDTSIRGSTCRPTDPLAVAEQKQSYRHANAFNNKETEHINIKSEQNSPPIGSDNSVQEDISEDSTNQQHFFDTIDDNLEDDQSLSSVNLTSNTCHSPLLVLQSEGRTATATASTGTIPGSPENEVHLEQEMDQSFEHLVSDSHIDNNVKLNTPQKCNSSQRLERLVLRTIRAQTNSVTKILNAQNEMFMKLMDADRAWQTRVESKLEVLLNRIDKIMPDKELSQQDIRFNSLMEKLDWALPSRHFDVRNRSQENKIDKLLDKLDRLIPALHPQIKTTEKTSE
ncbi:hypothetical protein C0J52_08718 [Blattella germanica]|nr:hypothetical protein C0J52_08718 [Blattella germanica]